MKILGIIQGCEIKEDTDGRVEVVADADIDCDGGSNPHHDPCWQPDTLLHLHGHAIDAESVPYIVVPPLIVRETRGTVMGSQARVTHLENGRTCMAVVADLGPSRKIGELSPAAARLLGINPNPNTGGEERHIIRYELWPGLPAVVDGITYTLQHAS